MKNIKTKNKNAITLIALVITIVIMLLLAAVAIQLTIGENGLIVKATQTKAEQAKAELYDTAKLEYLNLKTKAVTNNQPEPKAEAVLSETNFLSKYNIVDDNITNKKGEIIETKENLMKHIKNNESSSTSSEQLVLEITMTAPDFIEFYCTDFNSLIEIEFHDNLKENISALNVHSGPSTSKDYSIGKYILKLKGLNSNHLNGLKIFSNPGNTTIDILDWGKEPTKQTSISLYSVNKIVAPEPDYLTVNYYNGKFNSIPNNLFSKKSNNEIMSAFLYCNNITSIPEDLFKNCINAKQFISTFYICMNITNIPENIFKYNTNAEIFSKTFERFQGDSIPKDLFKYNIKLKKFENVFSRSNLKNIPENLFNNNNNINNLDYAFDHCTQLTNIPQKIINKALLANSHNQTFNGCTSASNYNSIPVELKLP